MVINPIKTQRDYRRILREIEGLMNAKRNTPEGDRLDVLVTLVEAWKQSAIRSTFPTPSRRSSTTWIRTGSRRAISSRSSAAAIVYETLSRKRPLTLAMVRRLHAGLGIPAESLIKEQAPVR